MVRVRSVYIYLSSFFIVLYACKRDPQIDAGASGYEEGEELSGGDATIFDVSPNAFTYQVPGLGMQQELDFFVGNSFFNQNWVTAPSSTTARDGLGPLFNARSCAGCHFKDGRGRPPLYTGETGHGLLFRLSIPGTGSHGEPLPDPNYGGQFQDIGIGGVTEELSYVITYTEQPGTFPDGEQYSLRIPQYTFNGNYGALAGNYQFSPRVAQQMIGLGLLEAVSESVIVGKADVNDSDGDGISGKANYVWNAFTGQTELGRFGWKANQPSLYQQTAGAFLGDIGITTNLFNTENCTSPELDCQNAANGGVPEIDDSNLVKVVMYTQTLAVPARRNYKDTEVLIGKTVFNETGCAKCHLPKLETGTHPISALSNKTIRPFTDLLLHDMGPALADYREDFLASGTEWRTQPLWGIGLIETVNGHTFFLHDGRARNLIEAILWHGGEAQVAKNKFYNLPKSKRDALIAFLNSL